MTDLDPAIWENETLGKAANNERLDRIERQQLEDRSARLEGREPRQYVVENDYPDWTPETHPRTGTVSSAYQVVRFEDENPNDIPRTGNEVPDDFGDETRAEDDETETPVENSTEGGPVETSEKENRDDVSW